MLGFIIGDLFTFAVLFNFTQNLDARLSFGITSVVVGLLGVTILFIVKEPDMKKLHSSSK
jgi:hypothetical protein